MRRACVILRRLPCACEGCYKLWSRQESEDDAMLPGQVVGLGRSVRTGAVLVLRFPRRQTPGRKGNSERGAAAGGSMAEEPDGHRFIQVRLRLICWFKAGYPQERPTAPSCLEVSSIRSTSEHA